VEESLSRFGLGYRMHSYAVTLPITVRRQCCLTTHTLFLNKALIFFREASSKSGLWLILASLKSKYLSIYLSIYLSPAGYPPVIAMSLLLRTRRGRTQHVIFTHYALSVIVLTYFLLLGLDTLN